VSLLEVVLSAVPRDASSWWASTRVVRAAWPVSIDRAIALGAHSDRLGHAFFGGYTAAVTALDPTLGPDDIGALCATESGGGHPRAIQTALSDGRLSGQKHFVSGGSLATKLLVVAKVGERDNRPELKLARVSSRASGVVIEDGATLDFVPEVPHGAVTFTDAPVEAVLEGDGYVRYLKPFRTVEDLHVFGAIAACLVSNGRGVLAKQTVEQLLAVLSSIAMQGREDPRDVSVHLALAGVLAQARALIDAIDFSVFEPSFRERFERDRPLLKVAERVRVARLEKAWSAFER
jgi:acyl-CoA dehydrogenase